MMTLSELLTVCGMGVKILLGTEMSSGWFYYGTNEDFCKSGDFEYFDDRPVTNIFVHAGREANACACSIERGALAIQLEGEETRHI